MLRQSLGQVSQSTRRCLHIRYTAASQIGPYIAYNIKLDSVQSFIYRVA